MDLCHGIIPCCYLVVKDAVHSILWPAKSRKAREAVVAIITILFIVWIFMCLLPFIIVYGFVHLCLTLRHLRQFGGILPTVDTIYESYDPKVTMNAVFIVSHDGTHQELLKDIKEACARLHDSNYRYSSIVKRFFGYRYYLKNQIHIDEVVVPVRFSNSEYLTREALYENLEHHQHYVKTNDRRLWEAKICLQPILWNDESTVKKHYAVIVRQNHSVSDAFSMMTYFKRYLCGEPIELPIMKNVERARANATPDDGVLTATIHRVPFGDLTDFYLKPPHENSDHHYAFFNETQAKYLPILFKLKKKYNTTISDIVAAGATESISKYFQNESINQESIFCVMTCRSAKENIADVWSGKIFGNESAAILMTIPTTLRFTALDKLREVAAASKKVRCSVDRQLTYISMKLDSYFPAFLNEYFFDCARATLAMTNLPLPEFERIGKSPVVDMFGFINHFNHFKFVLVVLSLKDQMRICLVARKGMVKNRDQLQEMLDGLLRYIDRLNEECDSNSPTIELDTRTH